MLYPPKKLTLLYYRDATKNVINSIAHIIQRIKAQPLLIVLPLSPMFPQSQTQDPSPPIITHPPAPAPSLESVVQPPRVKTPTTSPASPLRVKQSPSPISDPF